MYVNGSGIRTRGPRGEKVEDESFLVVLHPGPDEGELTLPKSPWATSYAVVLDTAIEDGVREAAYEPGDQLPLVARSVVLLRAVR